MLSARRPPEKTECHEEDLSETLREKAAWSLSLDGVETELCGVWLWLHGETRKHKDALKEQGFRWSPRKATSSRPSRHTAKSPESFAAATHDETHMFITKKDVVALLCRPNCMCGGARARKSEIVTTVLFCPSDSMDAALGVGDLHGIRILYRLYVNQADKGEPNGKD